MMRLAVAVSLALIFLLGAAFGWRTYLVHELRKPVLEKLNDPDSAVFREERVYGEWTVSKSGLCGQFNAKNKMGGYVGYRWFFGGPTFADIETDSEFVKEGCEAAARDLPWWAMRW